jgi:predicted DNA-binding transcriptional regulator AlpA
MYALAESVLNQVQPPTRDALYALPDILNRGKFSKSHVYNMMARGQFPQPVLRIGCRFTRWSSTDVDAWFSQPAAFIESATKNAA